MEGMTLRQSAKRRFFDLIDALKEAKERKDSKAFIVLSVQLHAAKAGVPKRLWPLANRI
jgi:hypothetical protein